MTPRSPSTPREFYIAADELRDRVVLEDLISLQRSVS